MESEDTSNVLFLSPHFDDAVLSCGGQLSRLADAGDTARVATIFAAAPDASAAALPFARQQHRMWGDCPRPTALRRAEDRAAAARLGITEVIHLPLHDAVYRRTPDGAALYASDDDLFGTLHAADGTMVDEVLAALGRCLTPATTVVAPLGAGHHVDHQIVRHAGDRLLDAGYAVIFYEELPYAEFPDAFDSDALTAGFDEELVELDEPTMRAKLSAARYYHTQIPVLYGSAVRMSARVRAYAAQIAPAGACYAERRWIPTVTNAP